MSKLLQSTSSPNAYIQENNRCLSESFLQEWPSSWFQGYDLATGVEYKYAGRYAASRLYTPLLTFDPATFPWVYYPAFVLPPGRLWWEGWITREHVGLPAFPIPLSSWSPIFPDFTRVGQRLWWEGWQIPASTFQESLAPVFNPATFPWGTQPDQVWRQQGMQWEGFVTPVHPALPSFSVPSLAWNPSYPDFTRVPAALRWEGQVTREHVALPSFPVPVSSWITQYPDAIQRGAQQIWRGGYSVAPVRVRSKTMVVISFSSLEDLFATAPEGSWFHTKTTASICTNLYVIESKGSIVCRAIVPATAGWNSDDGRLSQSRLVTTIELV